MNLANLSVAKKLIAAFSILGLVILVSGGIAILQTTRIEEAATISDRTALQAKSVNAVLAEAAKMQAAIRGLLITGSSTYGKEYEVLGGQMDAAIRTALDHAAGDEALVANINEIDGIVDATDVLMRKINDGAPFRIVGQPLTYTPSSLVVDRGDDALAAALKEIIEAMHKDGTLTRLSMTWFDFDLTHY